jgi:hypothetical protein
MPGFIGPRMKLSSRSAGSRTCAKRRRIKFTLHFSYDVETKIVTTRRESRDGSLMTDSKRPDRLREQRQLPDAGETERRTIYVLIPLHRLECGL